MPRVVMTAMVEDASVWEEKYRSHADLFREIWPGPVPDVHFATTEGNEVALCMDVDDLDGYFAMLERPEIAEAMAEDGVRRDTVKVFVLDKTASF
jgi:hypothetical protein